MPILFFLIQRRRQALSRWQSVFFICWVFVDLYVQLTTFGCHLGLFPDRRGVLYGLLVSIDIALFFLWLWWFDVFGYRPRLIIQMVFMWVAWSASVFGILLGNLLLRHYQEPSAWLEVAGVALLFFVSTGLRWFVLPYLDSWRFLVWWALGLTVMEAGCLWGIAFSDAGRVVYLALGVVGISQYLPLFWKSNLIGETK